MSRESEGNRLVFGLVRILGASIDAGAVESTVGAGAIGRQGVGRLAIQASSYEARSWSTARAFDQRTCPEPPGSA